MRVFMHFMGLGVAARGCAVVERTSPAAKILDTSRLWNICASQTVSDRWMGGFSLVKLQIQMHTPTLESQTISYLARNVSRDVSMSLLLQDNQSLTFRDGRSMHIHSQDGSTSLQSTNFAEHNPPSSSL